MSSKGTETTKAMSPIVQDVHERGLARKRLCLSVGAALAHAMSNTGMSLDEVDAQTGWPRGSTKRLLGRLLSGWDVPLAQIAVLAAAMDCCIRVSLSAEGETLNVQ